MSKNSDKSKSLKANIRETFGRKPIDMNDPHRDTLPQTGPNPHRELRRGPRGRTVMENVDDMVRGK